MPPGDLMTVPGQYQFDHPDGGKLLMGKLTPIRMVTVGGLLGSWDVRRQVTDRVGDHGGFAGSKPTLTSRTITLDMTFLFKTGAEAEKALDAAMAVFPPFGDVEADGVFSFWRRGKQPRMVFATAKRSHFEGNYETSVGKISGVVELEALDPRVYALNEVQSQVGLPIAQGGRRYPRVYPLLFGATNANGNLVITNDGNIPSPPILRIHGPVTNPYVLNSRVDRELRFMGTIAQGDYLEIDTDTKSIRLNGSESRRTMLDPVSRWWTLVPGPNDIRFLARTNEVGARLEIFSRSAWNSG